MAHEEIRQQRRKAKARLEANTPASGERRKLTNKERALYQRVVQRSDKILKDDSDSPALIKKKRHTAESTRQRRKMFEDISGIGEFIKKMTGDKKKENK